MNLVKRKLLIFFLKKYDCTRLKQCSKSTERIQRTLYHNMFWFYNLAALASLEMMTSLKPFVKYLMCKLTDDLTSTSCCRLLAP